MHLLLEAGRSKQVTRSTYRHILRFASFEPCGLLFISVSSNNGYMNGNITFTCHDDYLLARIPDKLITFERAQEILARIGEECSSLNCRKVLLDETSVERREVPPNQIKQLAFDLKKNKLNKVYIAFLCQPHLVGYDSHLLSLYTYMTEFLIQHFTDKDEAVDWLVEKTC